MGLMNHEVLTAIAAVQELNEDFASFLQSTFSDITLATPLRATQSVYVSAVGGAEQSSSFAQAGRNLWAT